MAYLNFYRPVTLSLPSLSFQLLQPKPPQMMLEFYFYSCIIIH